MDAISYSYADKQAKRIKKFIENPDSTSGVLTVPKVIAAGETITIPAGRVAVLPNVQVDGDLIIENGGDVFVPFGGTLVSSDLMHPVNTIADLRNETGRYKYVYVTGYHTKDDGAFGSNMFVWDENSTETDNGGTIIKCTIAATGRYKLKYSGAVNVKWFGAKGDGVTDDTVAFEMAGATGKTVFIPEGSYKLSAWVEGSFIATKATVFSRHLKVSFIDDDEAEMNRLTALGFAGSFVGTLEAYNDRTMQCLVYDKFSNVVYFTSNYNGEGTFIYAFDWENKNLIGTNHIPSNKSGSAFYGAFPHHGVGLYRPDEASEPLFFCAGNQYTSAGVTDPTQLYKLNLITWDYNNPHTFGIRRTWQLWDPVQYNAVYTNVCISEDGTQLCAKTTRTVDGVTVFGVWDISDILATPDGEDLAVKALRIFDSPYPWFDVVGQGMACDDKYIYTLTSGADLGPHHIYVIDIVTGAGIFMRDGSREGEELGLPDVTMYEGEALGFIPHDGKSRLILGVSINNGTTITPHIYNMEKAATKLNYHWTRSLRQGATGTSADFDNLNIPGFYYAASGMFSDLSGGAWYLEVKAPSKSSDVGRQIAYRGNTSNDIRVRNLYGGIWSPWLSFIIPNANGFVKHYPWYFDGSNTYDIADRAGAGLYKWQAKLTTGSLSLSAYGVDDLYFGTAIEKSNSYYVMVSSNELGKSFRNYNDNEGSLGVASRRWSQLYAATTEIGTSDARDKTSVADPNESLMKAWGKVNFKTFQFIDAVKKKGEDARVHFGVLAQQVQEAFESEGLDAYKYALFCYDKWNDQYEDVEIIDSEAIYDEKGNELTPQISHIEKKLIIPAGDKYGIRYSEALALEAAYQRWLGEQRDKEIAELKTMLANFKPI